VKAEIQRNFIPLVREADRHFLHLTKEALEDEMTKAINLIASGQIS
jgi:hypothetical protein